MSLENTGLIELTIIAFSYRLLLPILVYNGSVVKTKKQFFFNELNLIKERVTPPLMLPLVTVAWDNTWMLVSGSPAPNEDVQSYMCEYTLLSLFEPA